MTRSYFRHDIWDITVSNYDKGSDNQEIEIAKPEAIKNLTKQFSRLTVKLIGPIQQN